MSFNAEFQTLIRGRLFSQTLRKLGSHITYAWKSQAQNGRSDSTPAVRQVSHLLNKRECSLNIFGLFSNPAHPYLGLLA